jgi:hypothetical protein
MAKGGVKSKVSKTAVVKKKVVAKAKPAVKAKAAPKVAVKVHAKKLVSQKLIETIEKRKAVQQASPKVGAKPHGPAKPNAFAPPPKRRGRRPKNIEYTPENREEEESMASESDYTGIEYDTGIRLRETGGGDAGHREDRGFSFERMEDFDEELNFDW